MWPSFVKPAAAGWGSVSRYGSYRATNRPSRPNAKPPDGALWHPAPIQRAGHGEGRSLRVQCGTARDGDTTPEGQGLGVALVAKDGLAVGSNRSVLLKEQSPHAARGADEEIGSAVKVRITGPGERSAELRPVVQQAFETARPVADLLLSLDPGIGCEEHDPDRAPDFAAISVVRVTNRNVRDAVAIDVTHRGH